MQNNYTANIELFIPRLRCYTYQHTPKAAHCPLKNGEGPEPLLRTWRSPKINCHTIYTSGGPNFSSLNLVQVSFNSL